jgi:hypothetical protein
VSSMSSSGPTVAPVGSSVSFKPNTQLRPISAVYILNPSPLNSRLLRPDPFIAGRFRGAFASNQYFVRVIAKRVVPLIASRPLGR